MMSVYQIHKSSERALPPSANGRLKKELNWNLKNTPEKAKSKTCTEEEEGEGGLGGICIKMSPSHSEQGMLRLPWSGETGTPPTHFCILLLPAQATRQEKQKTNIRMCCFFYPVL